MDVDIPFACLGVGGGFLVLPRTILATGLA